MLAQKVLQNHLPCPHKVLFIDWFVSLNLFLLSQSELQTQTTSHKRPQTNPFIPPPPDLLAIQANDGVFQIFESTVHLRGDG